MKGEVRQDLPERTFRFAARIVTLCRHLDDRSTVSRALMNQLLRSGTSIGANIEEGQASQSEADFLSKYSIACKEARETHYWLRLLAETQTISPDKLLEITKECDELVAILTTIVRKVRAKQTGAPKSA